MGHRDSILALDSRPVNARPSSTWHGSQSRSAARSCGVRVAHRGLLIESEHLGEVERIGPVGQGLFELPVDAEPLRRRVLPAHRGTDPVVADPAGLGGGLVVDQQVEMRGIRPPASPVLQPVQQEWRSAGNDTSAMSARACAPWGPGRARPACQVSGTSSSGGPTTTLVRLRPTSIVPKSGVLMSAEPVAADTDDGPQSPDAPQPGAAPRTSDSGAGPRGWPALRPLVLRLHFSTRASSSRPSRSSPP